MCIKLTEKVCLFGREENDLGGYRLDVEMQIGVLIKPGMKFTIVHNYEY